MTRKSKVIKSIQKHLFCMLMICLTSFQSGDWGGIPNNQLKQIYITQKKCIKIFFGDYENYVDKFKTCARARPMNSQHLGSEFDVKESKKINIKQEAPLSEVSYNLIPAPMME